MGGFFLVYPSGLSDPTGHIISCLFDVGEPKKASLHVATMQQRRKILVDNGGFWWKIGGILSTKKTSIHNYGGLMPVERFEPSTLAGPVFETGAYTVPPHRLTIDYGFYNTASVLRSQ